jgi:hypothetical protein
MTLLEALLVMPRCPGTLSRRAAIRPGKGSLPAVEPGGGRLDLAPGPGVEAAAAAREPRGPYRLAGSPDLGHARGWRGRRRTREQLLRAGDHRRVGYHTSS